MVVIVVILVVIIEGFAVRVIFQTASPRLTHHQKKRQMHSVIVSMPNILFSIYNPPSQARSLLHIEASRSRLVN